MAIRGANYTDRATREVGRNIDELVKKQNELRQNSVMLIAGGLMWTAMAGMAVMAITKIMEASLEGRRIMFSFGQATEKLMASMGTAFATILGPTIKMLTILLDAVAKAPPWVHNLIASFTLLGITLLGIKGISMIMTGGFDLIMMKMTSMGVVSVGTASTMSLAFMRLQAAMGPIILGFTLGAQLAAMMGENAWMLIPVLAALTIAFTALAVTLWSAATALSILTIGGAAIAGVGAIIAAQQSIPSYQYGTEYVRKTGPAIVHEGDRITPASDRWMTPRKETPVAPYTKSQTNVTLSFGTVQTKADREELKPLILKTIREAMDDKV